MTGTTSSADFPTTSGVIDTTYNGGWDIILSKLNTELTSLPASSYLGGSGWDFGNALAVGKSGNVYVAGSTNSTDFSATSEGTLDKEFVGMCHNYVSMMMQLVDHTGKVRGSLADALFIFYSSGKSDSMITSNEYIYATGNTSSPDFQTTSGAYDTSYNGGKDSFVMKPSVDSSCTYSILPTSQSFSSGGGTGRVGVTASSGSCSWTAVSSESWITITSGSSGTGNGTVNPEGLTTTAWFEYGKKSGSYTKKSKKKLNVTGTADVPVSFTIFKLTPGKKYYYRLAAENKAGASYGSERTFTTLSK